jgi:hypothetical protein
VVLPPGPVVALPAREIGRLELGAVFGVAAAAPAATWPGRAPVAPLALPEGLVRWIGARVCAVGVAPFAGPTPPTEGGRVALVVVAGAPMAGAGPTAASASAAAAAIGTSGGFIARSC